MVDALALRVACPDIDGARAIARAAVEAGLAACGNIHGIESVYRWQGDVAQEPEAVIEFKTVRAHLPALCALINARHPYDLPAISWHAIEATPETLAWLEAETRI